MTQTKHRIAVMLTGVCASGLLSGCSGWDGTLDGLMRKFSGPTPKQQVAMAFDTEDPDQRREGIIGLSSHKWGLQEPYLKGYAAILKTDRNALVRAAAVRALGKAEDPNYLPAVAGALEDESETVRQDAGAALDGLIGPEAVEPLRKHALEDADKTVRANCARALRHYRRDDVYRGLVECLSDRSLAVRHQAHESLVALSGTDLGHEPEDWAKVSLSDVPAAEAGGTSGSWWDRFRRKKKAPTTQPATQPAGPDGA
jgi:hypothetical protein